MEKELIYIVEDDEGIREVYEGAFEDLYNTRSFENASDFFKEFDIVKPDLIILDIMLPDLDGYTILTKIREQEKTLPVIIVSAKTDEISFVKGLNKGADDYMAKPFSVLELLARVKTNLRRSSAYKGEAVGFTVDENLYKIFYEGKDLSLTLKEFYLLKKYIYSLRRLRRQDRHRQNRARRGKARAGDYAVRRTGKSSPRHKDHAAV